MIIVGSLSRDFLPTGWGMYRPTIIDLLMLAGSFGLFLMLFLLFVRYLPMVAMAEIKAVLPHNKGAYGHAAHAHQSPSSLPESTV